MGAFGGDGGSDAQDYSVAFVSKSLPLGSSPEHDRFAVPIVTSKNPGEGEATNSKRIPLRPRPFPWTGCYQYTVLGTKIAPTRIYHSAIEYKLDGGNWENFDTFVTEDHVELARQWHEIVSSMTEEEELLFERMVAHNSATFPVKVWQELTAVEECHDPREFMEEAWRFAELALAEAKGLGLFT